MSSFLIVGASSGIGQALASRLLRTHDVWTASRQPASPSAARHIVWDAVTEPVIRAALPALKAAPTASIVLFSTVAVTVGMPMHASVAAAKGAVEGLTRALAAELAPGIRVNAIAPSLTDTPLASGLLKTDRQRDAAAERHPLGRVGQGCGLYMMSQQQHSAPN